jgi:hypothetical protein
MTGTHLPRSICNTCKIFKWYGLTLLGKEEAELGNEETIVVKCYDVGSPSQCCWKSDLSECYFVEEFSRSEILELLSCGGEKLHIVYRHFAKFSSTILWRILQHENFGRLANI